jgi:hypothetical protein
VTEHDGKVTCAECLQKLLAVSIRPANTGASAALMVLWASFGVLLAWLVFYAVGTYLSGQPSELHGL